WASVMSHSSSVNSQTLMRGLHVAARIKHGAAKSRTEEIDQQLVFAPLPIEGLAFPVDANLRVVAQPRHQLADESSKRVISAEALIEGLLCMSGIVRIEHGDVSPV